MFQLIARGRRARGDGDGKETGGQPLSGSLYNEYNKYQNLKKSEQELNENYSWELSTSQ
jgi:hypothetical protein